MCRHLGAGDQEGACWDEMMGGTSGGTTNALKSLKRPQDTGI